ncbi:MAG: hypothetical protein RSE32_07385 [Comamonas sp.]|uniref:hypothetical protein n=1 Tax=Comamonas sp. TaxID=34028 RepID=UPI002FC97CE9
MRIDLSPLIGTAEDNRAFASLRQNLPSGRLEFSGPFRGTASIEPTGSQQFRVAGNWIQAIVLDTSFALLALRIPAPLRFKGVENLDLYLSYHGPTDSWTAGLVPMAWFRRKDDKIEALVGDWMIDVNRSEAPRIDMDGMTGFPIDDWGLAIKPMRWTRRAEHYINAGIFVSAEGRLRFLLAPEADTADSVVNPASPGLNLLGLKREALSSRTPTWRVAPLAMAFPLDKEEHSATWTGIVSWAPIQTKEDRDDDSRLRFQPILDAVWNKAADRSVAGARVQNAAQPIVPLPRLTVTGVSSGNSRENKAPLLLVDAPGEGRGRSNNPRLKRIFPSAANGAAIELTADFPLHARATGETTLGPDIPSLQFKGVIETPLPLVPSNRGAGETREHLRSSLDEALKRLQVGEGDDLLLYWSSVGTIMAPGSEGGWLVWGSLQFRMPEVADKKHRLQCYVRGNWTEDECDSYPEVILDLAGCQVRSSPQADAADRDLFAAFGVQAGPEDDLQRESNALRFPRRDAQPSRECNIRIRHRTDRGRVAVSRVEVRATTRSPFLDESVVVQLRPFSVAVVQPAEIDAEAGELIAVWSSNDPEGVQWRVPDATATVTLPPQGVGEAMERGARFWKSGPEQPWVDQVHPIAYRFAPPTQLVVRPSLRDRRYNKSPSNVSALLADAKVDSFSTETMYPIQANFKVSVLGLPDIRIRETGSMLGRPAENLPPHVDLVEDAKDETALERWLRGIYPQLVAAYVTKQHAPGRITGALDDLRHRHVAARATFAARLAEFHVYDPFAADGRLELLEGLSFRLRDTNWGAPPLLNPLPRWKVENKAQIAIDNVDLAPEQKKLIHADSSSSGPRFLLKDDWAREATPDGAFVGGVVHTMEFPSELIAVLRNPVATEGRIDELAFTALGANAHMAVSFDEGRTIFVGETSYGQLSRLIKIRIGRVAVLWNRARHVIVYERTTVPSQQFEDEQEIGAVKIRGWPILRKTEEFVEPLEPLRAFADEAQVKENRMGFIRASEFVSPRVYVNGAWGRDVDHGYEIPLWNVQDTSGFYPKPKLAVQAHAGGAELSRCLLDEPQHLYFYSNTEQGSGADTDAWPSFRGVDQPLSTPRVKVVGNVPRKHRDDRQNGIIDTKQMPSPRLGGLRRPRFDLKLVCEGKVNLLHARGETEMLGVMDTVTLMRTSATGASNECFEGVPEKLQKQEWQTTLEAIKDDSNLAAEVASAQSLRAKAQVFLEQAFERLAGGADCENTKTQLKTKVIALFDDAREALHESMAQLPALPETKGLLVAIVRDMEQELQRTEAAIRSPFDDLLADLVSLRDHAQGDAETVRKRALGQLESSAEIAQAVLLQATKSVAGWQARLNGTIGNASDNAGMLLGKAKSEVDKVGKAAEAAYSDLDIEGTAKACEEAIARLRALEHHALYGKVAGRCADALAGVRKFFDRKTLDKTYWDAIRNTLKTAIAALSGPVDRPGLLDMCISTAGTAADNATRIVKGLADASNEVIRKLGEAAKALRDSAASELASTLTKVRGLIKEIHANGVVAVTQERDDLILAWRKVVRTQAALLKAQATLVEASFDAALGSALGFAKKAAELMKDSANNADKWLVDLRDETIIWIDTSFDCAQIGQMRAKLNELLNAAEDEIRDRISGLATSVIDEATQARFKDLEGTVREAVANVQGIADEVSKGAKLVKALGDLPQLPTLTFNAERAEYVFDDLRQQIETSPFAAKLREIDSGLKELGLSIPTERLQDQFVPNSLKDIDFRKVFRNIGAMDFTDFFKRFKLPEIHSDQMQVTHGLDRQTRTAWVKAKIDAQFNEEQSLFELAGLSVTLAKLDIKANSNMSVGLSGEQSSKTEAKLKADWGLTFSSTRLATFRDVLVRYDGSAFGFDIEPKKVELHPALKFVDEFAKRFTPKLPPAVELEKDSRGVPVGAKAQLSTEVVLPPLGIVEIGPMLIRSGLAMRVSQAGGFRVEASVSVGSKDAPVWVQVSYLGGGLWLEARANYDQGVHYEASVGLALGCIKAFNLASVARGSFSFLLFAYATMSDRTGGTLRAGLQVAGNARIVGIANASVLLLLEAVHGEGKTEGHGTLDVAIDICWCYTLHVRKDVNHQIS